MRRAKERSTPTRRRGPKFQCQLAVREVEPLPVYIGYAGAEESY